MRALNFIILVSFLLAQPLAGFGSDSKTFDSSAFDPFIDKMIKFECTQKEKQSDNNQINALINSQTRYRWVVTQTSPEPFLNVSGPNGTGGIRGGIYFTIQVFDKDSDSKSPLHTIELAEGSRSVGSWINIAGRDSQGNEASVDFFFQSMEENATAEFNEVPYFVTCGPIQTLPTHIQEAALEASDSNLTGN